MGTSPPSGEVPVRARGSLTCDLTVRKQKDTGPSASGAAPSPLSSCPSAPPASPSPLSRGVGSPGPFCSPPPPHWASQKLFLFSLSWWRLLEQLRPSAGDRPAAASAELALHVAGVALPLRASWCQMDERRWLWLFRCGCSEGCAHMGWGHEFRWARGRATPSPLTPSLLPRLQCGCCQWGWSSAHVHILFHL